MTTAAEQAAKQLHELQQKDEVRQQLKRRFCDISGMGPEEPSLLQLMDIMDAIQSPKTLSTLADGHMVISGAYLYTHTHS